MNYAKRIKDLREDANKTQTEIANLLGIRQNVYSRYEVKKNEMPIKYLIKLSEYYGVSTDYILGLTNIPDKYPPF